MAAMLLLPLRNSFSDSPIPSRRWRNTNHLPRRGPRISRARPDQDQIDTAAMAAMSLLPLGNSFFDAQHQPPTPAQTRNLSRNLIAQNLIAQKIKSYSSLNSTVVLFEMKVLPVLTAPALLSMLGFSSAADNGYVHGKEPKKDAEHNISTVMAEFQQAAKNPEVLSRLFQGMQDPELMAKAREIMGKGMEDLADDEAVRSSAEKAKKTTEEPGEAAKMQAKIDAAAKDAMAEAMRAMGDPSVMAKVARLVQNPQFQRQLSQQLSQMADDPGFQKYAGAMQETMQDPTRQAEALRSEL